MLHAQLTREVCGDAVGPTETLCAALLGLSGACGERLPASAFYNPVACTIASEITPEQYTDWEDDLLQQQLGGSDGAAVPAPPVLRFPLLLDAGAKIAVYRAAARAAEARAG